MNTLTDEQIKELRELEGKLKLCEATIIACRRMVAGEPYAASTNIADEINYGYGELDANGFWEFPIPNFLLSELSSLRERLARGKPAEVTDEMVTRFLGWPLPESVCANLRVTDWDFPDIIGTHLLNADEAKQMLKYVLGSPQTLAPLNESEHNRIRYIAERPETSALQRAACSMRLQEAERERRLRERLARAGEALRRIANRDYPKGYGFALVCGTYESIAAAALAAAPEGEKK